MGKEFGRDALMKGLSESSIPMVNLIEASSDGSTDAEAV